MSSSHRIPLALTALLAASAAAASCSLGLDESKIVSVDATPTDVATAPPDVAIAPPDVTVRPDVVVPPDAAIVDRCARDQDCVAPGACLKGRCDMESLRCVFDSCPQSRRCRASACEANACGAPKDVPFHQEFPLFDRINTGAPQRSIAVIHPYIFVSTVSGVVAYSLADAAPAQRVAVSVSGAPFFAQYLVASGRRLYMLGQQTLGQAQRRVQAAWLDVPGTPLATELRADSKLVPYNNAQYFEVAFPAPGAQLFLGLTNPPAFALTESPFAQPIAPQTLANSGYLYVAVSGSRVVAERNIQGTQGPVLALLTGAGTASSQQTLDQSLATGMFFGPQFAQFTWGKEGSVIMGWPQTIPPGSNVRAIRFSWLLTDATTPQFVNTDFVEPPIANYGGGAGVSLSNFVGPMAWVDPNNVFVTFAERDNLQTKSVAMFVSKPAAGPTDAGTGTRTFTLNIPVGNLLAAASAPGTAYLAVNDPNTTNHVMHVFTDGCDP